MKKVVLIIATVSIMFLLGACSTGTAGIGKESPKAEVEFNGETISLGTNVEDLDLDEDWNDDGDEYYRNTTYSSEYSALELTCDSDDNIVKLSGWQSEDDQDDYSICGISNNGVSLAEAQETFGKDINTENMYDDEENDDRKIIDLYFSDEKFEGIGLEDTGDSTYIAKAYYYSEDDLFIIKEVKYCDFNDKLSIIGEWEESNGEETLTFEEGFTGKCTSGNTYFDYTWEQDDEYIYSISLYTTVGLFGTNSTVTFTYDISSDRNTMIATYENGDVNVYYRVE